MCGRYSITIDKTTIEKRIRSFTHRYFFCSGPIFFPLLVTVQ